MARDVSKWESTDGRLRIIDKTGLFLRDANDAIEKAIASSAIRVRNEAVMLVHEPYPPASKATGSDPPHRRTSTLQKSIGSETFERKGVFVGVVGTNLKYGYWLEVGTPNMVMRPYLRPALDGMRKRIIKDIKAAGKRMERGT